MHHQTAPSNPPEPDPRLVPVLNDDRTEIDRHKLGRVQSKARTWPLEPAEQDVLDALFEHWGGQATRLLLEAEKCYDARRTAQIAATGGTVVRETHRLRDGQVRVEREVERYSARIAKPRARGAGGRPKAKASRSSSRSGDSGDSSDSDDPEPPSRRLCEFCGGDISADRSPRAKYCSDKHADLARQRRKRDRDRTELPVVFQYAARCGCNGHHQEFDPGECFRCGHWLPGVLS